MCGCIASHRITITSAPPKDCINDEHSQTQYDLILRPHLTIAIAITVDSRPHSRMMQKNPPFKKSPKQYILKNACTQPPVPTIVHAKRKDKKTGHIAPFYYPCILSGLPIPHRAWSVMIGFGLGDSERNRINSPARNAVAWLE
ncbi:uncharacterized protein EAF02_006836 [Botrytis sinoallii]|uniref:uncharacterized protein n=1 Tax=Botrytis sinoallii TaxID=1463999 RepID=UPI001901DB7C|nr:uncharacterized protein EAF02_006836 [Botrytis sinoallii]KAF7880945.1 hypothetical protein EAF02_006836 [Botrytis sinoallii]